MELGVELAGVQASFTLSSERPGTVVKVAERWEPVFDLPRFEVIREVARGGMGAVLEATDRLLGRRVAIKMCLSRDGKAQQRLGREAAILSLLEHPSIPPVFELGRLASGAPYFVTRLIDGTTLEHHLRTAPLADALAVIADVADVMASAHDRGVTHRDLKPSNILVDTAGRAWVVDWGIARVLGDSVDDHARGPEALHDLEVTAPGTAIGTPGYWSPEQRRGEVVDQRSDIYSLGAILYRLATGRPLHAHVPVGAALTAALGHAPAWLAEVIARATMIVPDARYGSAAELAAELRRGVRRDALVARQRPRRGVRVAPGVLCAVLALTLCRDDAVSGCLARDTEITAAALRAGAWIGDFGAMAFQVDGDRVTAAYAHDAGRFEGTIQGRRVVGRWCEAPHATSHDSGDATFTLAADGTRLEAHGRFRYADDETWAGRWNMTRGLGAASPELEDRIAREAWSCAPRSE